MTAPLVVDADMVCTAVETTLRDHLPTVIEQLGLHVNTVLPGGGTERKYTPPRTWDQVPALEALAKIGQFPVAVGAITSPGLTEPPVRRGFDAYDATWRVSVGVYGRGRDYTETARRIRRWAAIVRTTLLLHPDLGAAADSLTWIGEEYRQVPQKGAARTLGGCAVAVDVGFRNVLLAPAEPPGPVITSTSTSVTVRPRQPQE